MVNSKRIRKILVVKLRNIGDVLLCAPMFDTLKAAYPEAQVSALVNSGTQEMLTGNPSLHQVMVYDRGIRKAPLMRRIAREIAFYRKVRRERFDLVINLTEGDRGALIALASGAAVKIGREPLGSGMRGKGHIFTHLIHPPGPEFHSVEKNLQYLVPLGLEPKSKRVSFYFTPADADRVAALLADGGLAAGGYFHAHVTSRWMFKALPPEKAAYLLDRLCELSGLPMVLTCSPDSKEIDYLAALRPLIRGNHLDLSGALTLKQLGALSASARFFTGVDSAPMHMAAALDVPVLGIFGPSAAFEWGPWDNACSGNPYQGRNGVQRSATHMVLQGAASCVPCYKDGCNGSKMSDCLNFSCEELAVAAEEFLSGLKK